MVGPFDIAIRKCAVLRAPWENKLVILDNSKDLLKVDQDKIVMN